MLIFNARPFFQGRSLSYKTFFVWVLISIYQGQYVEPNELIVELSKCVITAHRVEWLLYSGHILTYEHKLTLHILKYVRAI